MATSMRKRRTLSYTTIATSLDEQSEIAKSVTGKEPVPDPSTPLLALHDVDSILENRSSPQPLIDIDGRLSRFVQ